MIEGLHPVLQAFLGTLFTWGLTALGAAVVFVIPRDMKPAQQQKLLDTSLGFASGVMIAASYWSLLSPAIEIAQLSGVYGERGQWAFVPVSIGFIAGGLFVMASDYFLPEVHETPGGEDPEHRKRQEFEKRQSWRRVLLLVLAITIHNFPEGLAVGVGFGAIGKSSENTFQSAFSLAVGIGLQNFPEGLAVSLPLLRLGYSPWRSFFYGQLSGMVEPLGGMCGAIAVVFAERCLPYALAFAAGAMIYVVVDDLVPEARVKGNGQLASIGTMVGFVVMMAMDVGLG